LGILLRDALRVLLQQFGDGLYRPTSQPELLYDSVKQRRAVVVWTAAVVDCFKQFIRERGLVGFQSRGLRLRLSLRRRRWGRERGEQLIRVPQPAGVLEDPGRLDRDTAARLLFPRGEVWSAGHPVALRDDAGVLVGARVRADGIADHSRLL